jgi:hypothetical protein
MPSKETREADRARGEGMPYEADCVFLKTS